MSQFIEELNIDDISTTTTDSLLESLSLEIMESSISDQIVYGTNTSRDFLETVISKFNAIIEHSDDDTSRGIKHEMMEWTNRLILRIVQEYNLGYNNPGEDSLENLDILESLYHFFVIDRTRYTKEFFINYIDIHKKEIISSMGIGGRGNDITTIANKKKDISKYNIPILSNLTEVVNFIANSGDVTSETFLNLVDDGEVYVSNMNYYFQTGMLVGEFFNKYVADELGGFNDEVSIDLRIAIRMSLTN